MCTAAASKGGSSGLAWLILLVGVVLAFGAAGGEGLNVGMDSGAKGAAVSTPCIPDAPGSRKVESYHTDRGKFTMRCLGWRHMDRGKHGPINADTHRCIGLVLSRGKVIRSGDGLVPYQWNFAQGNYARVVVAASRDEVVNAFTRYGGAKQWRKCAGA